MVRKRSDEIARIRSIKIAIRDKPDFIFSHFNYGYRKLRGYYGAKTKR
jgi:hypothetical protein